MMDDAVLTAIITAIVGPISVVAMQELIKYIKNRKGSKLDDIKKDLIEIKRDTLRLQILNLLQHDPKNTTAISKLYDEYRKLNGNSYIVGLYDTWQKKFLQREFSSRQRTK